MTRDDAGRRGPILVLAPFGRDAESALALLRDHDFAGVPCCDVVELARRIDTEVAAVLMTEEGLRSGDPAALFEVLGAQPTWSDLPFVYLTQRRRARAPQRGLADLPSPFTNAVVLERPLGSASLLSAVEGAIASRKRQYQIRDQFIQLESQARELREATASLAWSEARFRAITESMPQIVWSARADGHHDFFNRRFFEYTGLERDGDGYRPRLPVMHEDDRESTRALWRRALATGEAYRAQFRVRRHDGAFRWFLAQAAPVRDGSGAITRWYGSNTDIDDQVAAQKAMASFSEMLERQVNDRTADLHAEMAERQTVEAALRQSQKMEAIGQLTGGIAHDFNNFLTGIIGNLDILRRRVNKGDYGDVVRFADGATASAKRAAALTHRLLAFSRQQTLEPRAIDLAEAIESMKSLLIQSLGEHITLSIRIGADTPLAKADPNQLESALLNMAINARDAMPEGGMLKIRTGLARLTEDQPSRLEQVVPGRYALLSVEDTGVGMSAETLARAAEPFFTTKPIGQGTGLGLSMIHGFARQSNGHLALRSELGVGTVADLYLPTADHLTSVEGASTPGVVPEGSGETIMVVEDDPVVRGLVLEVLHELGYATLDAPDAQTASTALESDRRIDLLISDVGLPGMNGRQLADIARRRRPFLKVLFMTGYADIESVRSGELEAGMSVIPKPFALEALATRISDIMQ